MTTMLKINKEFKTQYNQILKNANHYGEVLISRKDTYGVREVGIGNNYADKNLLSLVESEGMFHPVLIRNFEFKDAADMYKNIMGKVMNCKAGYFLAVEGRAEAKKAGFESKCLVKLNKPYAKRFIFGKELWYSVFYTDDEPLKKKIKAIQKFFAKMDVFLKSKSFYVVENVDCGEFRFTFLENGQMKITVNATCDFENMLISAELSSDEAKEPLEVSVNQFWDELGNVIEIVTKKNKLYATLNPPVSMLLEKIEKVAERTSGIGFSDITNSKEEMEAALSEHLCVSKVLKKIDEVEIKMFRIYELGIIALLEGKAFIFCEKEDENIVVLNESEVIGGLKREKLVEVLLKKYERIAKYGLKELEYQIKKI